MDNPRDNLTDKSLDNAKENQKKNQKGKTNFDRNGTNKRKFKNHLKGTVAPEFAGPLLTCMDRSGREKEPLLFLNSSVTPSIFGSHFKVLKL